MLKRILQLLIVFSACFVLLTTLEEADRNERLERSKVLDSLGVMFTIPDSDATREPEVFWPILQKIAERNDANLFRKASGYNSKEEPFTSYYIFLTSDNTEFYSLFRLRSGDFLSQDDTHSGSLFMSSAPSDSESQVGIIDDIGQNDSYFIYGMERVFSTYPVAGNYFVETGSTEGEAAFLSDLNEELIRLGVEVGYSGINSEFHEGPATPPQKPFSLMAAWIAILVVVVMVVFRQIHETKRNAVMYLYGYSPIYIWYFISGQLVLFTSLTLLAIGSIVAFFMPGSTSQFVVNVFVRLLGLTSLLVIGSLLTIPFIKRVNIQEALKDRKDTRTLAVINVFAKSVLCVVLIYMGATNISWLDLTRAEKNRLGSWEQTSQYGIFYPLYTGDDASETINTTTQKSVLDLYPVLNANGALYVEASNFSEMALGYETLYRSMRVNINYLDAYPVYDAAGNRVMITEDETDWVLLVPESYRDEENEIIERWNEIRLGRGEAESVWEADLRILGQTVDDPQPEQSIRIVWTALGQQVFSFNPDVYPEYANNIEDPIIEVMTTSNSAGLDKANGIDGGLGASIKVKLIGNSMAETYDSYLPLLKELDLDDNLRQLVTIDEAIFALMQDYDQSLLDQAFQTIMLFILFLVLVIQSVPLLFEFDARRSTIKRLYGYPFFLRQKRFFVISICVWASLVVIVAILNSIGGWPGGFKQLNTFYLFFVAGVFLVIETLVATIMLSFVEHRQTVSLLKGET